MKRLTLLTIILIILPMISAVGFEMEEAYSQGETIIAKVSGNFITPILPENIYFYRGHVRTILDYDVIEINDRYYIYASLLGKDSGNYSLIIKDTTYMSGSQTMEEDIIRNFTITNKTADFSIKPGFKVTDTDFFIEVQNLQDEDITLNLFIGDNGSLMEGDLFNSVYSGQGSIDKSLGLFSGQIEEINFKLGKIEEPLLKIVKFSTEKTVFNMPIYLIPNMTQEEEPGEVSFRFAPSQDIINFSTDSSTTRIIYLYNDGKTNLENISLIVSESLQPYVSISSYGVNELEPKESFKIEILLESGDEIKTLDGNIKARYSLEGENLYTYYYLTSHFLPGYIPKPEEIEPPKDPAAAKTCAELEGKICGSDEKCSEETINSKDGNCCLKTCEEKPKSSTGKIIGWGVVVAIILFLLWFFKSKYKRARRQVDLFDIARGKNRKRGRI